jgi:hypothetical protein
MKHWIPLLLLTLLFLGCKDDEPTVQTPTADCEDVACPAATQEFYGTGLMNGACWEAAWVGIDTFSTTELNIVMTETAVDGIYGRLYLIVNQVTNLLDTIWIGGDSNNMTPNLAYAWFYYIEDHSIVGDFTFRPLDVLTYKDFLLIDYFNADTTIVEGRFQVHFPRRLINPFVTHAPDSMRIECGRFRARAL